MRLIITEDGQEPEEFDVSGDTVVIGRAASCDVVVAQPYVSGRHAKIVHGIVVEDLGSTNGTFLGGERIDVESDRQHEAYGEQPPFGAAPVGLRQCVHSRVEP